MTNHLPLIDLPQHAGQASVLKEMLFGDSQWQNIVQINPFTPNYTLYGLLMLLTSLMSISSAIAVLVSISYVGFVYFARKLRQHFNADARLDWLFLLPFFGYPYMLGFMSFILAAPLALCFIWLGDRFALAPSIKKTLVLMLLGAVLLEAHGLMFLFAFGVAGTFLLIRYQSLSRFISSLIPFIVLFVAFVILYKYNNAFNVACEECARYRLNSISDIVWNLSPLRIPKSLIFTFTNSVKVMPLYLLAPSILVLFSAPWLLGLRIQWRQTPALVFFVLAIGTVLFFPDNIFGTFTVFERFSLFVLISYAMLFARSNTNTDNPNTKIQRYTLSAVILVVWANLAYQSYAHWKYQQNNSAIDSLMATLEPNQRMLKIITNDNDSENAPKALQRYDYYALWYQAEQGGFVDPNFSGLAPFPVRYQFGTAFDFKQDISDYRYILERNNTSNENTDLFSTFDCQPVLVKRIPQWALYDNQACMK